MTKSIDCFITDIAHLSSRFLSQIKFGMTFLRWNDKETSVFSNYNFTDHQSMLRNAVIKMLHLKYYYITIQYDLRLRKIYSRAGQKTI